jgi:indoleamine 2,3-dioxygenase
MSSPIHQLPASHFLSLPPSLIAPSIDNLNPLTSHATTSSIANSHAVNTATTASADFDVDVRTGFLPFEPAIDRLPQRWSVWEEALRAARGAGIPGQGLKLGGGKREEAWRKGIREMPVLPIEPLQHSLPLLRRAHQILTFLLHFYVHSHPVFPTPRTIPLPIPESISVPLLTVCPLLGLPPVLTYADTVLYNSHPTDRDQAPEITENPYNRALETFTNTPDEAHFYLTSTKCELAGVEALTLMRASLDEAFMADALALTRLTSYLTLLAEKIDVIGEIILEMKEGCDPAVFYHVIRPWFKGGDSDGPQSAGWAFLGQGVRQDQAGGAEFVPTEQEEEGVDQKARKFSGPSAGQSTLIHALDVFLNVEHSPVQDDDNEEAEKDGKKRTAETTFMTRMLEYMPAPHRAFLTHLGTHSHPIRTLVLEHQTDRPLLVQAYDKAIEALKRLREKHMRIATIYIIQQARRPATEELFALGAARPVTDPEAIPKPKKLDLSEFIHEAEEEDEIRGTGGTALIKFLKMCRDNTGKTRIGA